jgi:probable phosphoglycerate mutase
MRNLYVVTHTQSQHHLEGVVVGWFDSDLSEHGRVQASRVAVAVRKLIPPGATARVYTSDMRRAVQTAEPIAEALGVQTEPDARLREISYGSAEGQPQEWLEERFVPAPPRQQGGWITVTDYPTRSRGAMSESACTRLLTTSLGMSGNTGGRDAWLRSDSRRGGVAEGGSRERSLALVPSHFWRYYASAGG